MPFTMEELMSMPKGNGPRPSEAWSKEINADGQIGFGNSQTGQFIPHFLILLILICLQIIFFQTLSRMVVLISI